LRLALAAIADRATGRHAGEEHERGGAGNGQPTERWALGFGARRHVTRSLP
jgi:hypothetical protein